MSYSGYIRLYLHFISQFFNYVGCVCRPDRIDADNADADVDRNHFAQ